MRWPLHHLVRLGVALLLTAPHASALHESNVGVVDWHKFLVGVPLVAAPVTAPSFRTVNSDDKNDVEIIYTATGNNVLAALNPKDGSVVWRYIYEPDDRISGYYPHSNFVATLSGTGGATFRIIDGITGTLHLQKRLHAPEFAQNAEPPHLGSNVAFGTNDDVFVLTEGRVVRKIDGTSGIEQWTWNAEGSMTIHTNLVSTSSALYVIAFTKSIASLTLHVTVLDPRTGAILRSRAVPSSVKHLHTYAVLSTSASETEHPHVVWIENGLLRSFKLTSELDSKPGDIVFKRETRSMAAYERISDVGLTASGNVVAVASDGSATLLGLVDGCVEGIGALAPPITSHQNKAEEVTESTWIGGLGFADGEVVVGRVYWSHKINKVKAETLTFTPKAGSFSELHSPLVEISFDTSAHGIIVHTALSRSASNSSPSLLLTTTTGTVQLWELTSNPVAKWTREEALAAIVLAEFIQLPEGRQEGLKREGEGFFGRIWRHLGDAKNFPQYLSSFIRRFLTGSYASTTSVPVSLSSTISAGEPFVHDAFGFRQIIVAATAHGKIFGLDSSTGRVIWSRVLGLGWAAEVGASVLPIKMFVLGGDSEEDETKGPEVVIIAQRRADNTLVDTVIFHINAITGAAAPGAVISEISQEDRNGLLQGHDIIPGPVVEAFLLLPPSDSSDKHEASVLLLDEFLQVYLYPSTPQTRATLRDLQPSLHFPLRTNAEGSTRIMGHSIGPHYAGVHGSDGHDGERGFVAYPTWTLGLPPDEIVKTMISQHHGPVASLGKVLGNRTTLYKYLNPRLFVLLTTPSPATPAIKKGKRCGLYVVDGIKGTVVYRTSLPALNGKRKESGKEMCDVKAMLVENWLVYHYYDPEWEGTDLSKGWKVVSVELYEGRLDEKTRSSDMTSFADENTNVFAYEQAYLFPHAITALSPTSTKFGMTVKDLIVASSTHQVRSIQRHLLNPRRPSRKVTSQEQEEFLVSYEPVLAYDPRRVLSHNYEVANVQRIKTSPTLLESTSFVFAYGLDMFITRVAPSNTFDVLNENFNKAQLVLTVSGLALAIIITKPMVQRKKLREQWYHQ